MSLVFIDTETTGLDPARHQIWEIAFAVDDGPIQSGVVHHSLIGADPVALDLNGYWERQDDFDRGKAFSYETLVRDALEGNTLVAANPAFDAKFLQARWGVAPWKYRMLDIESFAAPYVGVKDDGSLFGLKDIAWGLGVEQPDHSARQDVNVLRQCFWHLDNLYAIRL